MKTKGDGDRKIRTDAIPVYGVVQKDLDTVGKNHPEMKSKSGLYTLALHHYARFFSLFNELKSLTSSVASHTAEVSDLAFVSRHNAKKTDELCKKVDSLEAEISELKSLVRQLVEKQ